MCSTNRFACMAIATMCGLATMLSTANFARADENRDRQLQQSQGDEKSGIYFLNVSADGDWTIDINNP